MTSMNIQSFNLFHRLFDKLLHMQSTEQKVNIIKQSTDFKVQEVSITLKKAGRLQNLVVKKTTTYYFAKALGILK